MYKYRSRDRRLMEQTARDIACMLQRDYFTFSGKKSTQLSNKIPFFSGYLSTGVNAYPNISWIPGSEVDAAFGVLQQLLTNLYAGAYQTGSPPIQKNPGTWPPATAKWPWILSLYAYINPAYAAWLTANNIVVPAWA